MANEQTWPSEEEMTSASASGADSVTSRTENGLPIAKSGTTPKSVRRVRVPKGTSTYQAAWIVDPDSDGDEEDGEEWISEDGRSASAEEEEEMEELEVDKDGFRVPAKRTTNGDGGEEGNEEGIEEDVISESGSISTAGSRKNVVFEDLDMEEEGKQYVLIR